MGEHSAIEWTGATWNPVTGCTRVSPGCANCYIVRTPPFFYEGRTFERVGNVETTGLRFHPERLDPKKVKRLRPLDRPIFVCSLSDLFHEEIPADFICEVFATMRATPGRTFQVLTKRPERAIDVLSRSPLMEALPLPNVWLGVTVENARWTGRVDLLREIPAAVRFVSAEPLLGSLFEGSGEAVSPDGGRNPGSSPRGSRPINLTGIDWIIVGGESGGRGVRPMHPDWAREIRDECLGARNFVRGRWQQPAFFFKQWGSWAPTGSGDPDLVGVPNFPNLKLDDPRLQVEPMRYAGANPKAGGRLLDGRTWDEMPGHAGQGILFEGAA